MKIFKEKLSLFLAFVMIFGNLFLIVPIETTAVASHTDNPCSKLGYDNGFKIDGLDDVGSFDGTYYLQNSAGPPKTELMGSALADLTNYITILDSDDQYFNWTSSFNVLAVIVKGGNDYNFYDYSPSGALGDSRITGLHAPVNASGHHADLSHIAFCYNNLQVPTYNLEVSKTVNTGYTRTYDWGIEKSANPETLDLFQGDTGSVDYTVDVTKSFEDSNFQVSGVITIENDNPVSATIESVTDTISPNISALVTCGQTFPYELAASQTLECNYSALLTDGSSQINTASVITSGQVLGGSAVENVVFGDPTTVVGPESVNISDTNGLAWGFNDSGSVNYSETYMCDDEGENSNTATINETQVSSTATVMVNCHELEVIKTVNTSFDRQYTWVISKLASVTSLVLQIGATASVDFTVSVDVSGFTDSNFQVSGDISVHNPAPIPATIVAVTDMISPDIAASVNCPVALPGYLLASGETLTCAYQANLPDDTDRDNTATVTIQNTGGQQNGDLELVGVMATTDFTDTKDVSFSEASMNEIDECIEVSDSMAGVLGTACYSETLPKSFTYSDTVGPFATSGIYTVNNLADFVTNDTETKADDPASVEIAITVLEGSILGDTDERKPTGSILGATDALATSGSNLISLMIALWLILSSFTVFYFIRERKIN